MTNAILVPINLQALYSDGTTSLANPQVDFSNLPYYWADTPPKVNPPSVLNGSPEHSNQPFLSENIIRKPADLKNGQNTFQAKKGYHLHWTLPNALTTHRTDPNGKTGFPKVPNRYMMRCFAEINGQWVLQNTWVIESDYLYPRPKDNPTPYPDAITFPVVPPDALDKMLNGPTLVISPTPDQFNQDPYFYMAPFRYMGRKWLLDDWRNIPKGSNEYLSDPQYRPEGLTAAGYGDPLFAAIYSNCYSVFGFHDDKTPDTTYPRRYDLIGWYEDAESDPMKFFDQINAEINPYEALDTEFRWAVDQSMQPFPTDSLYFSSVEIPAKLSADSFNDTMDLSVGNTGMEAFSTYLSNQLSSDKDNQRVIEEQLEALSLRSQLDDVNLDLAAKFAEARHDKAFKSKFGGNLWSVSVHSTGQKATTKDSQNDQQVTLPDELAKLLNDLNVTQSLYDQSCDQITSLQHRAFADWYRFELTMPNDGDEDMLAYFKSASLLQLQQTLSQTGALIIDEFGEYQVSSHSGVQHAYTLAQELLTQLQQLDNLLQNYNNQQSMKQQQREYSLLKKIAPRYKQPNDISVLFEGESAIALPRYGIDSSLPCTYLSLPYTASFTDELRDGDKSGVFKAIEAGIEALRPQKGDGFQTQTEQPWYPVSLEWEAFVYPETGGTTEDPDLKALGYTELDFNANYIDTTYEFDIDASDLRLKVKPSKFIDQNPPKNDYVGRVVLTPYTSKQMAYNISAYMLSITLYDLKQSAIIDQGITDEFDYQLDAALIAWAQASHLTITNIPTIQDPVKSKLTQAQIVAQQAMVAAWMKTQIPFGVKLNKTLVMIDLSQVQYDTRPFFDQQKISQFSALTATQQLDDPLHTAIQSDLLLAKKNVLSQSLTGFNEALLTRRQTLQLPIWDWRLLTDLIEDQKGQFYARDLSTTLGTAERTAPLLKQHFMPIRAGVMDLQTSYFIDSFGQVKSITPDNVIKSESLTISRNIAASVKDPSSFVSDTEDKAILLKPRLTQPAQMSFRWLAANAGDMTGKNDEPEMNDHPATTPVCGWFIVNNLDASLMVFDTAGNPLGSLVSDGTSVMWESAPGIQNQLQVTDIPNVHLQNLVQFLISLGSSAAAFWKAFLASVDSALENIAPESYAHHQAISLLISRPVAVVRANLALQIQGLLALNQGTGASAYNFKNLLLTTPFTNQYEAVEFPVRVGEYKQLNDGLVGYWVEDGQGGFENSLFRSSEIDSSGDPTHIKTHGDTDAVTISLSLTDNLKKLTMLVDPFGYVHASSGILPSKAINIPPDQYADALKKMAVTFLTAPIITSEAGIELPLPVENGYAWSWLDRPDGAHWRSVPDIQPASSKAVFKKCIIDEGWLKLSPHINSKPKQ